MAKTKSAEANHGGLVMGSDGRPVLMMIDTFCPECGELATGSVREGLIHIPCGECLNHGKSMNVAFADAIPLPFHNEATGKEETGFVSRAEFRHRFPSHKEPAAEELEAHWQKVVAHMKRPREAKR